MYGVVGAVGLCAGWVAGARLYSADIIAHGGRTASRHAAFGASSLTSPTAYEAATAGVLGRGGGRVGTRGAGPPA